MAELSAAPMALSEEQLSELLGLIDGMRRANVTRTECVFGWKVCASAPLMRAVSALALSAPLARAVSARDAGCERASASSEPAPCGDEWPR